MAIFRSDNDTIEVELFTEAGESWGPARLQRHATAPVGRVGRTVMLRASGQGMFIPWRGNTRVVLQFASGRRGHARLIAPEGRFNLAGGRWEQAGELIETDQQVFTP